MNCLFCPDYEIACHDFDNVEYRPIGMLYGASCNLCDTFYNYHHILDSEDNVSEIIESYTLKTLYKNRRYLLTIYEEAATLKVVNVRSSDEKVKDSRVKFICEFIKPNNITPSNFKQKLPVILAFS
jgi:hypothetical protein